MNRSKLLLIAFLGVFSVRAYSQVSTDANGNVGIGTTTPLTKLHVEGSQLVNGSLLLGNTKDDAGYGRLLQFDNFGNTDALWIGRYNISLDVSELRINLGDGGGNEQSDKLVIGSTYWQDNSWNPFFFVHGNGRVGIGTANVSNGDFKLFVESGIRTRKVRVDQNSWADFVFSPQYRLLPLPALATFIQKHNHLPDIPSAAEVSKEGIDLGDMNARLLQKIEELTLYTIDQDKKLREQQQQLEAQQQRLEKLEKALQHSQPNTKNH